MYRKPGIGSAEKIWACGYSTRRPPVSALVVGLLVLSKPLILYLDGKKKEAGMMLFASIAWLATFTIIALLIQALIK